MGLPPAASAPAAARVSRTRRRPFSATPHAVVFLRTTAAVPARKRSVTRPPTMTFRTSRSNERLVTGGASRARARAFRRATSSAGRPNVNARTAPAARKTPNGMSTRARRTRRPAGVGAARPASTRKKSAPSSTGMRPDADPAPARARTPRAPQEREEAAPPCAGRPDRRSPSAAAPGISRQRSPAATSRPPASTRRPPARATPPRAPRPAARRRRRASSARGARAPRPRRPPSRRARRRTASGRPRRAR